MALINGLLWLLGCQLAGEVVAEATGAPVPGPVLGMVLLLGVLLVREPAGVARLADGLLGQLQLFFVPPAVGVVAFLGALRADAVPVTVALVGSWLAGLLTVAGLASLLRRRHAR